MLFNALLLALREIRRNLMRSGLTILGIVIGVAAVITMVTLGNGATQVVSDQISSLGSNLLMIRPGQRLSPTRDSAGSPNFKLGDVEAIEAQVKGLNAVAPSVSRGLTVVNGAANWSTTLTGTTPAYFVAGNWVLKEGRLFSENEDRAGKAVCVIGNTVQRELFGAQEAIGQSLRIKQFSCEVIGVLASKGQGAMGMDQDDTIVMPLRTVQRRLMGNQDVRMILVSFQKGADPEDIQLQLRLLLRERRHLSETDSDNFNILDTKQIAETLSGTIKMMTLLLSAVAAVSLLVGGIGIMNIMLVSVTERTREIGIRLAIGALEHEVLWQFLIESIALSSLGGILGILLALAATVGLSSAMGVPFLFDLKINVLSFVFSAAIGVIFGFFPARRAAHLDPIEALRHE